MGSDTVECPLTDERLRELAPRILNNAYPVGCMFSEEMLTELRRVAHEAAAAALDDIGRHQRCCTGIAWADIAAANARAHRAAAKGGDDAR